MKKVCILIILLNLNNINNIHSQIYGTFKDPRDGNIYKTIKIGSQIWMAENLRTDYFRNGEKIRSAVSSHDFYESSNDGFPILYSDNEIINGKMYNFYTVNDSRNLAPIGWHIPTVEEYKTLINFIGGDVSKALSGSDPATLQKLFLPNVVWTYDSGGDPIPCVNCKNWNYEYRSKVACNLCRDTRIAGYTKKKKNTYKGTNSSGFSIYKNHSSFWTSKAWNEEWNNQQHAYYDDKAVSFSFGLSGVSKEDYKMSRGFYIRCIKN